MKTFCSGNCPYLGDDLNFDAESIIANALQVKRLDITRKKGFSSEKERDDAE
jgi:hypothetical protein